MIGKLNMDPIDNVSRDSKDGTYRCPQCQTPFTRRSNLRRHFQIHLRGSPLKCEVCNEEHSTKDSLQNHVTTSHSPTWNVSHGKPQQSIIIPQDILSSTNTHSSPFATVSPANYVPFSSQNTSTGQYSSLASPAPARAFQVPNFGGLSLGSPNASSTAVLPRSTSSLTSDRRIATLGSPPRPHPFSHRRSSTSSSSISVSPIAPSSPYTRLAGPQQHYGLYPPSGAPPFPAHQDWLAGIMGPQGPESDERPIYTRQQVKNMLDVVSDCIIESVESVWSNIGNGQRPPIPSRSNSYSATLDNGVRQMILNEAIPRLVSRVQGTNNVSVMPHANGGY